MNKALIAMACAGAGAGAAYLLDPNLGRRRRAILRDKLASAACKVSCAAEVVSKDLANRVHGVVAESVSLFENKPLTDDVLCERIRSKLGRYVSYPRAIEVQVEQGHVTLCGMGLTEEVQPLVWRIKAMHGVSSVENRLEVFEEGIQPAKHRLGAKNWLTPFETPAARFLIGTGGIVASILGSGAKCSRNAFLLGTLSACMIRHSVSNLHRQGGWTAEHETPDTLAKKMVGSQTQTQAIEKTPDLSIAKM